MNKVRFKSDSTLAQQCFEQLQNEIIEGILKPGEKLKVEPIKERFSIGQSPIREALSRLVAFGLVEVEENKGFRVARVSEEDIRDTYQIFAHIENLALELAMKHGDDAWKASIVGALYKLSLEEQKKGPISYALWAERNYDFHLALISGCNSPILLQIRRDLYMKFDRYCRMAFKFTKHNLLANYQEHTALAEAVLNREVKKAKALMECHILGAVDDVIKQFKLNNII